MSKKQLFYLLFMGVLILSSCQKNKTPEQPNIILVFVDDMGYGDLECYGHPLIKTPNLNKMAKEGIRFTSFYAPGSVCSPSRAGVLTGRYPIRNSPNNFGPESTTGLPLTEVTIAEVLKGAGYRTAAIGKWHLGHKQEYLPTSRGFDSFYGLPYSNDMLLPWCPWLSEDDRLHLYRDTIRIEEIGKAQNDLTVDYSEEALSFIKEQSEQPFFLYLAHSMPHLPISTSNEFRGKSLGGLYGDVIETIDWTVGELMKTLKELKIEENTLVVFTSDNGPWNNLPERMLADGVEEWHTGSSGMLRGAKATTYEGGFRVPSVMHWPGTIPPDKVNREIVSAIDLFPTFVEIANVELPEQLTIDGKSILSLVKGNDKSPRTSFFYGNGKTIEAVRENEWKLRITEEAGTELFNLNDDPYEKYNRAEAEKIIVNKLYQKLSDFVTETSAEISEKKETD